MLTYVGLLPDLAAFCKDNDYTFSVDPACKAAFNSSVSLDDLKKFYRESDLTFVPHDYQHEAVKYALQNQRGIILSSTGSGKSFIIYLITKYLVQEGLRGLLIVPTISLVEQMFTDFEKYSSKNGFPVDETYHRIYGGKDRHTEKAVSISTWQSMQTMPAKHFEQFEFIIGDEVHLFEASACNRIVKSATNAVFRIGLTGTIEDQKTSEMTLKALFGPIRRFTNTKELMERNVLASLSIQAIILKHDRKDYLKNRKDNTYAAEVDYVLGVEQRTNFIQKLVDRLEGNSLVLFNFVEKHGKPMFKKIQEMCPGKKVYLVYGGTDAVQREKIRAICEKEKNAVIVASFGVFSTGVSITNLHNLIFSHSTKSKIRVLQSIGRVLRVGEGKDSCTLYDIVDDVSAPSGTCYGLEHFQDRYALYIKEGFPVKVATFVLPKAA